MASKKGYAEAIERDAGRCRGCGKAYTQVHHITFRSHGGTNDAYNLVCLCDHCHRRAHNVEGLPLPADLLRVVIETSGNVDRMNLKTYSCFTCRFALFDVEEVRCSVLDVWVRADEGCRSWARRPANMGNPWLQA